MEGYSNIIHEKDLKIEAMIYKLLSPLIFIFFISCFSMNPQEPVQDLDNMLREDSAAITALALYPAEVRKNILEACSHPEALVRIEAMQRNTSESFRKAIEGYSKEEQQKVWDLSRYPGLISGITQGGKKNKDELNKIVSEFPQEIRETAIDYGTDHFDILKKVNLLNVNSEQAFESVIREYPEPVKNSYRNLVKYPEVISILTSDMKMSVLVGDIYKKQPQLILHKLDSISTDYATQNAKDLEEWKNGLEKNPEAKEEMVKATKEFAKEQGYNDDDIAPVNETVVVNYVIHPYPYWYGYPWWYDYPYWYPYPYWYDWGFYHGPVGIVYIGFPSPFFTYWYFNHPHHHYHYNHFSDYCVGHYYGHHRSVTGFHREVSGWVKSKETVVPKNFFANDPKRPEKIKELGKFDMDYDNLVKVNPSKPITQHEFLQSNASSYPNIKPVLSEPKPIEVKPIVGKPKEVPVHKEPIRPRPIIESKPHPPIITQPRPVPRPQAQPLPRPQPKPQPMPQPRPQSLPQSKPAPKQNIQPRKPASSASSVLKDDFGRMSEALDYHRSNWDNK